MSTYTPTLGLERITPGDQSGLWGNTTNNNLTLIDQAVTGVTPISFAALSGSVRTLTDFNGAADEARSAVLNITGSASGANTVVVPNKQKTYLVRNNTGQDVIFQTPTPGSTFTVGAGNSILVFCDGANNVFTGIASPSVGTLGVAAGGTGNTTFTAGFIKSTGGTNALISAGGVNLASADVSGTLPVANGGTGAGTFTAGNVLTGNGTGAIGSINVGAAGQALVSNGSVYAPANTVNTINAGSNISISGSAGNFTISATSGTSGVTSVSATSPLSSSGGSAPNISISSSPTFSGTLSAASLIGTGASGLGDQRVSVSGFGYGSGMAPAAYQCGSGGFGLTYTPSRPSLDILGGVLSAYFTGSSGVQGNNSPNWTTVSDQNLKTNFRPIGSALAKLNALNPCHFEYKDEIGTTRSGFIAQEFATVFPGHVTEMGVADNYKEFLPEGQDKIKALDPNLMPYLVKAIQELSAKVTALEDQVLNLSVK